MEVRGARAPVAHQRARARQRVATSRARARRVASRSGPQGAKQSTSKSSSSSSTESAVRLREARGGEHLHGPGGARALTLAPTRARFELARFTIMRRSQVANTTLRKLEAIKGISDQKAQKLQNIAKKLTAADQGFRTVRRARRARSRGRATTQLMR